MLTTVDSEMKLINQRGELSSQMMARALIA